MDTEELSAALRAATAAVDAPPGFTERVRRGARRRVVRRRYRICAVVLAVLAIGGGLTALSAHLKPEVDTTHPTGKANANGTLPTDDPRLHDVTRGDLAQNQSLHDQVVAVWQHSGHQPLDNPAGSSSFIFGPAGPVNVYWAGSTSDGPAAVLLQAFSLRPTGGDLPPVAIVRIGVVADATKSDTLTLEDEQTVGDPDPTESGESFAFGPDNRAMLTLAESGFHVYSAAPIVNPDTGNVGRTWRQLPYVDGVAVVDLSPDQGDGSTVVELPRQPDATSFTLPPNDAGARSPYQPVSDGIWAARPDPRLKWPIQIAACAPPSGVSITNQPDWSTVFDTALRNGKFSDPYVRHPPTVGTPGISLDSESHWHVGCWLANGDLVILGEELVGRFGRLYAVTVDAGWHVVQVGYGGEIDPNAVLPVRYRLPDGSGWLVAAYGSHLGSGNLNGSDALALPAGTTTVTVTKQGGAPQTIPLNS